MAVNKTVLEKKRPRRRRAAPAGPDRSDRRREEILDAALKLFSERGYGATSTKDIGKEIGLLAGSLYYHIHSKEDLLYEILLDLHTYALAEMATIKAMGGSPVDRLRLLIRNHVVSPNVPRIRLFESEFHHLSADRHAKIHNMRKTYLRYVIDLIEEAQAAQLCSTDVNAPAMALALLGLVNSMPRWFNPKGEASIEQIADTVDRMLIGGLGAGPGQA
jgi:TetR/AcrR family transcriptional regulator, cholesterol catabolism regulator